MNLTELELSALTVSDSDLPEGWASTFLTNLCSIIRGVSYSKDDVSKEPIAGLVALLRANNIGSEITFQDLQFVPPKCVSKEQMLKLGDVVVAMSSGSKSVVGKGAAIKQPWTGTFGAFCGVLRPNALVDKQFFGLFFHTRYYRSAISEASAGTNINNLKRENFDALQFPLPPLAEQRRIVAKLEQILAATSATRARLAHVPVLLKRFRQAVLAAACSGRLTADWREQNPNIEAAAQLLERILAERRAKWEAEQASKKRGKSGTGQQSNRIDPFLHTEGVTDIVRTVRSSYQEPAAPDTSELPELPQEWEWARFQQLTQNHDGKREPIKSGDRQKRRGQYDYYGASGIIDTIDDFRFDGEYLLISEDGANLLARSTPIAFRARGKFWVNNHAHAVQAWGEIPLPYLEAVINGLDVQNYVTGSAQPKLTQEALNNIYIPLPPLAEQQEIVRRVEHLFRLADAIEKRTAAATLRADRLTQSLLAKAFRGELVPTEAELARTEGSDYEPASVLLERVQTERTQTESKKSRRNGMKFAEREDE